MASYNNEVYLGDEALNRSKFWDLNIMWNLSLLIRKYDDSLKIAKKYQEDYPYNIQVISKENGGQASTI